MELTRSVALLVIAGFARSEGGIWCGCGSAMDAASGTGWPAPSSSLRMACSRRCSTRTLAESMQVRRNLYRFVSGVGWSIDGGA